MSCSKLKLQIFHVTFIEAEERNYFVDLLLLTSSNAVNNAACLFSIVILFRVCLSHPITSSVEGIIFLVSMQEHMGFSIVSLVAIP